MKLKRILTGTLGVIGLLFAYHYLSRISFQPSTARSQESVIPTCLPDATGNVNYNVAIQTGQSSFPWADAAGCVNRPLIETWAVTHNPDEMGVSDQAQSTVKPIIPAPEGATHLYQVTYKIQKIISISWTLDWLHQLPQGTLADPREVLITLSKVSGSSFISHFAGTVHLLQISPTMTLAATHLEVKAPEITQQTLGDGVADIINRLRTGTPNYGPLKSSSIIDFE